MAQKSHPYHNFRIPSNAPFELKPSTGKGWGAFATRPIKQGDPILTEKALFLIRKPADDVQEADVRRAFLRLTPAEKQQFKCLRDNASAPLGSFLHAFLENYFEAQNLVKYRSKLPFIGGLYLLLSRFNHSCSPNSKIPMGEDDGVKTSFAIRDIAKGEDITFCYSIQFEVRTRRERHQDLDFECRCKACCGSGALSQWLSDARRTLIRGLRYLNDGVGVDGERESSRSSPIIIDPKLKKDAEEFKIPFTNRLIYQLLIMCLKEEEGLPDHYWVEHLREEISMMTSMFMTPSNIGVVQEAMAKETWLERLCVAACLYGRRDTRDEVLADMLGEARDSFLP
ncbi:hypothetical protein FQN54_003930 [Arachnomyces sp. PD_36]|nr:hypothetical protein FQN54_003930 [Arachnomyces sp. PD_36]